MVLPIQEGMYHQKVKVTAMRRLWQEKNQSG